MKDGTRITTIIFAHDAAMTFFTNRIIVQSAVCGFCGKVGEVGTDDNDGIHGMMNEGS